MSSYWLNNQQKFLPKETGTELLAYLNCNLIMNYTKLQNCVVGIRSNVLCGLSICLLSIIHCALCDAPVHPQSPQSAPLGYTLQTQPRPLQQPNGTSHKYLTRPCLICVFAFAPKRRATQKGSHYERLCSPRFIFEQI